ncbi:FkbM family methyltransferase [Rhizobiales bacterium]|uniref:FkbM family methyltransferase n=1 Tax=Hongsoonwoonella zoysiae TaxID=2821844 RepID=UPI0015617E1F|nr:FkbM family methyltransferase [Hongsoonwoonella zoysiae]NRG18320.1 FkbM family methyltransferase [Hongsoonwoonella zoysiae]
MKRLVAAAYIKSRPDRYEVPFAGSAAAFLTDRPYPKTWYFRNRLKRAIHGYHEPAMTFLLERLAESKTSLLDIGSHLGYFSVLFASVPDHHAAAIELDPSNFRELDRCFKWQPEPVRGQLHAYNLGISDAPGTLDLPKERPHNASHHINSVSEDGADLVTVELTTVDDFVTRMSPPPDVVKIDVEGFEVHALRGASTLLSRQKPVLLIEVHPPQIRGLGEDVHDVISITKAAGYTHFQFHEHRGLQGSSLTRTVEIEGDANRDLICIHQDDEAGLKAVGHLLD